jgi:hypothetical protein
LCQLHYPLQGYRFGEDRLADWKQVAVPERDPISRAARLDVLGALWK